MKHNTSAIMNYMPIVFILFLMMCGQPTNNKPVNVPEYTGPFMDVPGSKTITLTWDPPEGKTDSVDSYELSYRTNSNQIFSFLKNIPASDSPTVVLHRDSIQDTGSIFYFRVRSVMKSGLKSAYHYTTDSNAVPKDGWFLKWD